MIKTVLFGTSKAANNFLTNDIKKREYIIAVDNNSEQHGKEFHSMKIIGVDKLSSYEYDEIVVASFAGLEIKHQLLSLGVDESKIYLPQKSLLKAGIKYPFEDELTLNNAREVTKLIASRAYEKNIPLHIECGTLLGILRDGDLIRWDDDVDFSSIISYQKEVENFIHELKDEIQTLLKCELDILITPSNIKLTIMPISEKFYQFEVDIDFKFIKNNNAIELGNQIFYTPAHHTEKLETFLWEEITIFIPSNVEAYLEFIYKDWKKPQKEYSLDDYNHYKII